MGMYKNHIYSEIVPESHSINLTPGGCIAEGARGSGFALFARSALTGDCMRC